jgi:hypothetical protein
MHLQQKRSAPAGTIQFMSTCIAVVLSLTAPVAAGWSVDGHAATIEDVPAVAVESNPAYGETIYSIIDKGCTIQWIVYTTELNRGVIKHRARCPLPLARQLPSLSRIVEKILATDKQAPSFHTLFWGGLMPESGPSSLEMPLRLALAAYRSRGWSVTRGRPVTGDTNKFVKDLANSESIYPELIMLFERAQRKISIASVEKVRVLAAGSLPFYGELKKAGVRTTDRLPFDCMVWFSVTGPLTRPGTGNRRSGRP